MRWARVMDADAGDGRFPLDMDRSLGPRRGCRQGRYKRRRKGPGRPSIISRSNGPVREPLRPVLAKRWRFAFRLIVTLMPRRSLFGRSVAIERPEFGFVPRPMASFSEGLKQIIAWWKACGCAEAPDRQIQIKLTGTGRGPRDAIRSIVPEPLICVRSGKGKGRRSAGPRSSYLNLAMLSLVTRVAPELISDFTFSPRIAFTRASTPSSPTSSPETAQPRHPRSRRPRLPPRRSRSRNRPE